MKRVLELVVVVALAGCGQATQPDAGKSAARYFEEGDLRSAEISLANHLKAAPESPAGHWLLGRVHLAGGNPIAAEVDFRRAIKYGVKPAQVLPELAAALLAQEKYNALIDELVNKKLGEPAVDAAIQTALALAYMRQDMKEPAEQAVAAALQILPDHAPAMVLKARLMAARGQIAEAGQTLDGVLARSPKEASAWTMKGDLLLAAKAPDAEVLAAYRKATELDRNAVHPHTVAMTLLLKQHDLAGAETQLAAMRKGLPMHPNTGYFDASLAFERGDYQRAQAVMQALLPGAPDNPTFLLLAGKIALALEANQQAQSLLERVVLLTPDSALARRLYAQTLLANGLPDKAIDTLRPALRARGPEVESFALAARIYQQLGDVRGEAAAFESAERLDPKHPLVRIAKALTVMAKGNLDSAFAQLAEVAAADSSPEADLVLVRNAMRLKRFELAAQAIDRLETKQPDAALPHSLRGELALARRDFTAARGSFDKALVKQPDLQSAVDQLARLDLLDKKPETALARYQAQIGRNPANANARLAMADIKAQMAAQPAEVRVLLLDAVRADPTNPAARAALIRHYLTVGPSREALLAAQGAIALLPNDATLLSLLGDAQVQEEDYNNAVSTYRRLLVLRPRSAEAYARLSGAQSRRGDLAGASDSLDRALKLAPDWPPLQEAAFGLAMRERRVADAVAIARRLQASQPQQAMGFRLEGDAEAAQKRWEPAMAMFRKALSRPDFGDTAVRLHTAMVFAGKTAEAAQFAQEWRGQHKTDAGFVNHLAETALVGGDMPGAEALFGQVIELDPRNASALNNLAYLALGRQDKKALALAERAVSLAPNSPLILDTLARAQADAGQLDRAVETQKRAVDLAPRNAGLRLALAKLYLRADSKERARQELTTLAQLGKSFSAHAEVAAVLREANR